ncbi:MAG TPA: hypothetical protein VIX15_06745 [Streptosporangiaceae bacterium]
MTEHAHGPTGPGTVVLELGADTGALILYTPADLDGAEIEISRHGDLLGRRTHSQVRQRPVASATKYAAVYSSLTAGQYTIWHDDDRPALLVTITGGQITSCRWPE